MRGRIRAFTTSSVEQIPLENNTQMCEGTSVSKPDSELRRTDSKHCEIAPENIRGKFSSIDWEFARVVDYAVSYWLTSIFEKTEI